MNNILLVVVLVNVTNILLRRVRLYSL